MQSKNGYPAFHFFCILAVKPNASSDTRFWGLSERATGPGALTPAVEEEAEAGREALTPAVEEALVAEKLEAFVTFPTLMAERTFTASLSFISFCFLILSFFCLKWVLYLSFSLLPLCGTR